MRRKFGRSKRRYLRADTVLAGPEGISEGTERYLWSLPGCCKSAFRAAVQSGSPDGSDRREPVVECECGNRWRVVSSLDEPVLKRFEVSSGSDSGSSAA